MIITPIVTNYFNFVFFEENFNFMFSSLVALMGTNIIANSFFVSLLEIDEIN